MSDTLQGYGNKGSIFLGESTNTYSGCCFCIQFVSDGSISELVGNIENAQDLYSATFQKGEVIFGIFSKVTLESGTAIVYKN